MLKRFPALLVVVLALAAPATPYAVEPANLDVAKREITAYIASGEYGKNIAEVALRANKWISKRVTKAKPDQKLAVVFDIDETTLTNLSLMQAYGFGYNPKVWNDWVNEGRAPAIIPVQTVYDNAVRHNVAVFFITARTEDNRAGTEKNLREVGYETWTRIYFLADKTQPRSSRQYKTEVRRDIESQGYTIIANIGDQDSDLLGGHAERFFKLPNPFYVVR